MSHVYRSPEIDTARPASDATTPTRAGRWMRPEEVRIPLTVAEADAALDMMDETLARLEGIIAQREAKGGHRDEAMRALMGAWAAKRAQVAYYAARIEAGESPASAEADAARERAEAAEAELGTLRAELRAARAAPPRNADLERQVADLVAKNARLARELEEAKARRSADTERARYRRGLQDMLALAAVTIEELLAAGAPVSPLAAFVVHKAKRGLPPGFVREWRAMHLSHILPYAVDVLETGAWREDHEVTR